MSWVDVALLVGGAWVVGAVGFVAGAFMAHSGKSDAILSAKAALVKAKSDPAYSLLARSTRDQLETALMETLGRA